MLSLPSECILNILARLPLADVVATASCCTALRQAAADDCFWAALAEAKWGVDVRQLKTVCETDVPWRNYCYKRMSARTISRSPLNLLQESYPDPWQHITCCVLCSRTSGSELIRIAIAAFFKALPTPTAVLAAEDELLKELLHPLGLQASRMAAVRSVSHKFLATDWQTPAEFYGCGKFVEDSWRIFCRGLRDSKSVADANLKAYLSWLNRQDAAAVRKPRQHCRSRQRQQGVKKDSHSTSARRRRQQQGAALPAPAPTVRTRAAAAGQAAAAGNGKRSTRSASSCAGSQGQRPGKQRHQQLQNSGRAQRV